MVCQFVKAYLASGPYQLKLLVTPGERCVLVFASAVANGDSLLAIADIAPGVHQLGVARQHHVLRRKE